MRSESPALNAWENTRRTGDHAKHGGLEEALKALNDRLRAGLPNAPPVPLSEEPILFIVGCARSGSTLLFQVLAAGGEFCYPTNFISRFFADPVTGALAQRALHDLDHKGEIFPERFGATSFASELGRAKGAVEPHDFGYFWKFHFAFGAHQGELVEPVQEGPASPMVLALRGMQGVFGRPLVMKAMQMDWHLDILERSFPNCVFLHIERDPYDNALSLLGARRKYFGDEGQWYSFRPPQYDTIKDLAPMEQALAQVHYTNKAVREQLDRMSKDRWLRLDYSTLCAAPDATRALVLKAIGREPISQGPEKFPQRSHADVDERKRASDFLAGLK